MIHAVALPDGVEAAFEFYDTLYPNPIEFPCYLAECKDQKIVRVDWFEDHAREDFCRRSIELSHEGRQIYFGVNRPEAQLTGFRKGKSSEIAAVPGLYMDVDVAGHRTNAATESTRKHPSRDVALRAIECAPLPPSLILDSGGGLYPFWLFDEPFIIQTEDDRQRIKSLLKGWESYIRWILTGWGGYHLDSTADLPRILRLPGTVNHKYGREVQFVGGKMPSRPQRHTVDSCEYALALVAFNDDPPRAKKWPESSNIEIDDIRSAMDALSKWRVNEHDPWIEIGMCLHAHDEGLLDTWIHWSRAGDTFDEAVCAYRWSTFSSGGGLTIKTLFKRAYEDGWKGPEKAQKAKSETISAKHGDKLELIASKPRETAGGKIIVPTVIRLDDKDVDRLDISTAASNRAGAEKHIAKISGMPPLEISLLVGEILQKAAKVVEEAKSKPQHGDTIREIVRREVPPRFDLKFLSARGSVYSGKRNNEVTRQEFTTYTPSFLVDLCREAIDAPRNASGITNESTLIRSIMASLGVVWADEISTLPSAEHEAELDLTSSKSDEFRAAIFNAWVAQSVYESVLEWVDEESWNPEGKPHKKERATKTSLQKRSLKNDALDCYWRAKINDISAYASRAETPGLCSNHNPQNNESKKWQRLGGSRTHDAYFRAVRLRPDQGLLPVLAMRWTLLDQTGKKILGVNSAQSFKKLGVRYGAFLPDSSDTNSAILNLSDVPAENFVTSDRNFGDSDKTGLSLEIPTRMTGGQRLCVLHPRLTAEILADLPESDDMLT